MTEPWGKPEIPPAVKEKGEVVTRFNGWIDSSQDTPKGYRVIVMVPMDDKYKASLAVDQRGIMLHFEVFKKAEEGIEDGITDDILSVLGEDG